VDEVVEEGLHPGHRYPAELLAQGKRAVERNLAQLLELRGAEAEFTRREKFFAMGVWGESETVRHPDTLAKRARGQQRAYAAVLDALNDYFAQRGRQNGRPLDKERTEARQEVARMIYAAQRADAAYVGQILGVDARPLSLSQWARIHEHLLGRRYGHPNGTPALHPNGGVGSYQRLHPVCWIERLTDEDSFREFPATIRHCSVNQLGFPEYEKALARGTERTGLDTGLVTGSAGIRGFDAVLAINNFGLVGSSLCDEIGEKFRYAAGQALERRTPLVSVAMGGGARMQEGTPSMHRNIPKIHHALNALEEAGLPHISVVCDPTLGGTAISYALRGDYLIVVEGSANIGFSGKRVVEQFRGCQVSPDFQHGSWLLRRGFVDECVHTDDLPNRLAELLEHAAAGGRLSGLQTRVARRWQPKQTVPLAGTACEPAVAGP
jgi:acetyl-CoA carboxylase beta subunit